jgi:hypothetical protein
MSGGLPCPWHLTVGSVWRYKYSAQLPRLSVPTGNHPERCLVISAVHAQLQGRTGSARIARDHLF